MSRLKKRIIIIGSACLLAVIGIGTYLLLKNNAGKKDREIPAIGEVDEMAEEIADLTEEDNGMIPDEQLCEADITEPDKMTLLSITPVGERISIGSYGSEELGWIVYDEDEEYLYLISEKVIDARPMIDNTASLYELAESSAEYNGKFTDTDLCKWLNDEFINSVFSEEVIEKMQQWSDGIKVTLPDDEFVTEFGDYLWAGPTQTAIENGAEVFNPEPYIEAAGEVRDPMTGELIPEDEIVNHPGLVYPAEADGSASYALGNDITDGIVSIRSFGFTRRNAGIYEKVGVRPMIKVLK